MLATATALPFLPLTPATAFPSKQDVHSSNRLDAGVAGIGSILGRMDFPHFLLFPIGRSPACCRVPSLARFPMVHLA